MLEKRASMQDRMPQKCFKSLKVAEKLTAIQDWMSAGMFEKLTAIQDKYPRDD